MSNHINPALREKLARPFSIALTFVAVTMVPAMVAVIAPANTAVAPEESRIAGARRRVPLQVVDPLFRRGFALALSEPPALFSQGPPALRFARRKSTNACSGAGFCRRLG